MKFDCKVLALVFLVLTLNSNAELANELQAKNKETPQILLYIADLHFDAFWSDKAVIENQAYKRVGSQCKEFNIGDKEESDFSKYNAEKVKADRQDPKNESQVTWKKPDVPKNIGYLWECNTNINLLDEVLRKAAEITNKKPDKIFILGDSINHNLYVDQKNEEQNYTYTFEKIQSNLDKHFKGVDRCFVVGNNDFVQRYKLPTKDSFNSQIKRMEKYMMPGGNYFTKGSSTGTDGWLNTWYAVDINPKVKGIVINSILYNPANSSNEDATKLRTSQMEFIENELSKAEKAKTKVIINDHIQIYKHLYMGYEMVWDEAWAEKFATLMKKYKETVLMIFSAHLHLGSMAASPELSKKS